MCNLTPLMIRGILLAYSFLWAAAQSTPVVFETGLACYLSERSSK